MRKILCVIIFFIISTCSYIILGAELNPAEEVSLSLEETYEIKAEDIKMNYDQTGSSIDKYEIISGDNTIVKIEKNNNTSIAITGLKEGTVKINVTASMPVVSGMISTKTSQTKTYIMSVEKSLEQKIEEAKYKDVPSENPTNYMDIAYWVMADANYNQSKKLIELAKTDAGIEKMKAWVTELSQHIRGGTNDSSIEYLSRTILQDLISANKDQNALEDAVNGNQNHINNIMATIISLKGKERNPDLFKSDVLDDIDAYDPSSHELDGTSASRIENVTSKILTVISNIGIAVSVIMLAVLGIKYMLGSVEEKAEYKEGLIPYVIGAFILFGITGFIKILIAIGDKIGNL